MVEAIEGNIENAKNEIRQKFNFFMKWKDLARVNTIESNLKEFRKEFDKVAKLENKSEIGKSEAEMNKEIMLLYQTTKMFLELENDLIHVASKLLGEENKINQLIQLMETKHFPENTQTEVKENAHRAFDYLNGALRRISDMFGAETPK